MPSEVVVVACQREGVPALWCSRTGRGSVLACSLYTAAGSARGGGSMAVGDETADEAVRRNALFEFNRCDPRSRPRARSPRYVRRVRRAHARTNARLRPRLALDLRPLPRISTDIPPVSARRLPEDERRVEGPVLDIMVRAVPRKTLIARRGRSLRPRAHRSLLVRGRSLKSARPSPELTVARFLTLPAPDHRRMRSRERDASGVCFHQRRF